MRNILLTLVVSTLTSISFSAHSNPSKPKATGNYLHEICLTNDFQCAVVINSTLRGYLIAEEIHAEKIQPLICLPKGATQGQLIDLVKKFLSDRPEIRHQSAYELIIAAVLETFPCKKK